MQQIENIEEIFKKYFAKAITPDRIIELGTGSGEFTNIIYNLRKQINDKFDFITIDNLKYFIELPPDVTFHELDIFNNIESIGNMIKENSLILCDNGDKIKEVSLLYPYLKSNCVIMAHDYFLSLEDFKANIKLPRCWEHCEITFDDVKHLDLQFYFDEIMKEGFWLSMIKL